MNAPLEPGMILVSTEDFDTFWISHRENRFIFKGEIIKVVSFDEDFFEIESNYGWIARFRMDRLVPGLNHLFDIRVPSEFSDPIVVIDLKPGQGAWS